MANKDTRTVIIKKRVPLWRQLSERLWVHYTDDGTYKFTGKKYSVGVQRVSEFSKTEARRLFEFMQRHRDD